YTTLFRSRGDGASRSLRYSDRGWARPARRRHRHHTVGLYPRPGPEPGRDLELLSACPRCSSEINLLRIQFVIPAEAGIQGPRGPAAASWTPASAGVTVTKSDVEYGVVHLAGGLSPRPLIFF